MKQIFILLIMALGFSSVSAKEVYMLVGTYTSGKSKGIYVYKFNNVSGESRLIDSIEMGNPSFLAVSLSGKLVYAVGEDGNKGNGGTVRAFAFNTLTGKLKFLNEQKTGGDHPCYVAIDKTTQWVTVANYSSGSLSIFKIEKNGSLSEAKQVIKHSGSSIDKNRQNEPHVHSTVFTPDNKFLLVQDLGIDKVMVYGFNSKSGMLKLDEANSISVKPGSGPRHLSFDGTGKFAYLIEEMSATVSAYTYSSGKLNLIQTITMLPGAYEGNVGAADIHVSTDGNYLYASNRGDRNELAIYKINKTNGKLTIASHQSTLGKTPRNFNFDPSGKFLLAANQNSNSIIVFKINAADGTLAKTSSIDVGNPVCIQWVK